MALQQTIGKGIYFRVGLHAIVAKVTFNPAPEITESAHE